MLSALGIKKSFGGVLALRGVNIDIQQGELLGLIGPNGSGKSTLINVISGFLQPDEGRVALNHIEVTGYSPPKLRRIGVARTFQNLRLFEPLTARENMEAALHLEFTKGKPTSAAWIGAVLGSRMSRKTAAHVRDRAVRQLDHVGLSRYADTRVADLPFGLRKRLEIGRVLISDPDVILLDEPTAGLSPAEAHEMIELIVESGRGRGCARGILLVEHHLELVFHVCHRIVVMNEGSVLAHGLPSDMMKNGEVQRVYVGI